MKKTPKKLLGLLGLLVVVAITIVAAALPNPEASATSSVTDTITVRVVGAAPNVDVTGIESGDTTTTALHNININYEVVDRVSVILKHTDKDGNVTTYTLADFSVDYVPGNLPLNLNLLDYGGYGNFEIIATGEGVDGVTDESHVSFTFLPAIGMIEDDEETGNTILDLEYDAVGGTETGEVDSLEINIYDKDGNLVTPQSPIHVNAPDKQVILPFDGLPDGDYTIEITAYNSNGEELYKEYIVSYHYGGDVIVPDTGGPDSDSSAGAPDTGGLFGGLNISKADYLATGLLIFFLAGIGGIIFISRREKRTTKRKK